MTAALIGHGSAVFMDNSTGVSTELGEITSLTLPNPETQEVEATHFKSPNRRREYIAGLIEDGEGTFEMNLVPGSATDALIRQAQDSGDTRDYRIVIPADNDGETWEVTGQWIVRGYERMVPNDDRMTARLTVRFTGAAAEAAGA